MNPVWSRALGLPLGQVTNILSAMEQGDPRAAEQLLSVVYVELRELDAQELVLEKPGQTFQATALVHEAYHAPNGAPDCSHGWSGAAAEPPPPNPWNGSRTLPRPARGDGEVNATGGVTMI
ncbi:MAG TPA: ECF-type sigma factor [Gemmataceae bacterium]|nr:ECF-type sigma factor [Gemmataceae bacterium]